MFTQTLTLSDSIAASLADVARRVLRSLVVVHNGRQGAGAGVAWRPGGYIVTNNHVVAHGRRFGISLPDGGELPARILATDAEIDLALLKVDNGGACRSARLRAWASTVGARPAT